MIIIMIMMIIIMMMLIIKRADPVVLVGRDGGEARLLEHERLVVLLRVLLAVLARVHVDHVEPGLVPVHGVQDDLHQHTNVNTIL